LHQLENSIRFTYGNEIDARTNIQKIYRLIVQFPTQGRYRHERHSAKYINFVGQRLSLNADDIGLIKEVSEARQFSLRTIERILTYVSLAKSFTPENYLWLDPIIVGLCIMKVLDGELFRRACSGRITVDEVESLLAIDRWPNDASSVHWSVGWWKYCLADKEEDYPDLDWRSFKQSLFRYSIHDRKGIIGIMADHLERLQLPSR
jgi:hypothetical protein